MEDGLRKSAAEALIPKSVKSGTRLLLISGSKVGVPCAPTNKFTHYSLESEIPKFGIRLSANPRGNSSSRRQAFPDKMAMAGSCSSAEHAANHTAGGLCLCLRLPVEGDNSKRRTSNAPDDTAGLRGCHFEKVLSGCLFRKSGFRLRRASRQWLRKSFQSEQSGVGYPQLAKVIGWGEMAHQRDSEPAARLAPTGNTDASKEADQLDAAGQTILSLLHKAAGVAEANSRHALDIAQKLSISFAPLKIGLQS